MGKPVTIHHSITIFTITLGRSRRVTAIKPHILLCGSNMMDGWPSHGIPFYHAITGLPAISGRYKA